MLHLKVKRLKYQKCFFSFDFKNDDTIPSLQYAKFMQAVTTCAVLKPETLPLRESAIYSQSLRFHLQVCK